MTREQIIDRARERAIERAKDHAHPNWFKTAYATGVILTRTRGTLTSEDVFDNMPLNITTHEPRAMGSVMRALKDDGWITPTGTYIKSSSIAGHGRPSHVWKSVTS